MGVDPLVVGELAGICRHFVQKDSLEARVLGSVDVNVSINIARGSRSVRSVHVSDHIDTSGCQLVHVGGPGGVGTRADGSAAGVDDGNDFSSS